MSRAETDWVIALAGNPNVGKSTLFKILTHQLTPDRGSVKYGVNIDIGYYDQHQQNLNPANTVLDEVWNSFPSMEQSKVRGALGLFLFTGDDVFKPIHTLSGGEKGRVALTALMLRKDNLRHGVEVSIQNDKLVIELHIIVAYEVSILAVAENLVDNVKYKVEEFTGMEVGKIVVCVEGVRVIN